MADNIAVFGIYRDKLVLEAATKRLGLEGFRTEDISCLFPIRRGTKDFAHIKKTKASEGSAAGAGVGALVGGTLGWLVGAGIIIIPGLGALVAAGPILSALAGAGAVGTLSGLGGALVGIGLPEYEAKRYEGLIKKGKYLISVHCDDAEWKNKAREILKQTGATDIAAQPELKVSRLRRDRSYSETG